LNIAAVYSGEYHKTKEGFEVILATNHLGPFLLTNLLRDRLVGRGRVITVSAPASNKVDINQLMDKKSFRAFETFGATKAANLLFTFELARRAKRWEVRANACHPGIVRSELMREAWAPIRIVTRWVSRPPTRGRDLADLAISAGSRGHDRLDVQRHQTHGSTEIDDGCAGAGRAVEANGGAGRAR
jgi:NAD(P)-dependent dehydrogenase (short-subunit alcohol dehydrogenase family)